MNPPSHTKHHAFTVLELLVVMSIIILLAGLLIIGIGHLQTNAKTNATKSDLQNVRGMFDEMNAGGRLSLMPTQWLWRNIQATATYPVYDPTQAPFTASPYLNSIPPIDFWNVPMLTPDPRGGPPAFPQIPDCLDALGTLIDDGSSPTDGSTPPTLAKVLRHGSRAVLNTQLAMRIMLAYPANKAALAKLPADRLFIPEWVFGAIPHTGPDGIYDGDDSSDTILSVVYAVNNSVKFKGATFRCILAHAATAGSFAPPSPTNPPAAPAFNLYWVQDTNATPLILDAWNNPLIFVPTSGLINVYGNVNVKNPVTYSGGSTTVSADPNDAVAALPNMPGLAPSTGRYLPPIQAPDHRPFFVSAGPDGNLLTGDDNIYSFEK